MFDTVKSSARSAGAAVEFNDITITENGIVSFQSTDPQKKIFNHDVQISFKEEPTGSINFENVNFNQIFEKSRDILLKLSKTGRVTIGTGCIKYRYQTETKKISVKDSNVQFILEICQVFKNYFIGSNGLNLGFEIVERNKNEVHYFYFTDENITINEFFDRLKETERNLWGLLSTRDNKSYLALKDSAKVPPQPSSTNFDSQNEEPADYSRKGRDLLGESEQLPAETMRNIDGAMSLMSILFRIGIRYPLGFWKKVDTQALVNAIRFGEENVEYEHLTGDLHQVIVDKYTGEKLYAIHLEQNEKVPRIIAPTITINNINQIGIGQQATTGHNSPIKK